MDERVINGDDAETRLWVRYHVIVFFLVIGVAAGLVFVDSRISEIVRDSKMPGFRAILFLSVLLAGLGARALLAWRSATVDLQGRIFLAVAGLALLTIAAVGLSDCLQEFWGDYQIRNSTPATSGKSADRTGAFGHSIAQIGDERARGKNAVQGAKPSGRHPNDQLSGKPIVKGQEQ